jgi:two-component system sensor histidine kinase KdpD
LLSVVDEGVGLSGEEDRVFGKFHRGAGARPGGLGLGLSIVKGFAEAQGGTVQGGPRADGHPGAEFQIRLPVETKSVETIGA